MTEAQQKKLYKKHNKLRAERSRRDPAYRAYLNGLLAAWKRLNPEKFMVYKAKERAKKYGLRFNLSPKDIVIPTHCPVLGMRLRHNKDKVRANSPTLDRIKSNKGYVKGNVMVISHKANTIKNNATPEELMRVAKFYM